MLGLWARREGVRERLMAICQESLTRSVVFVWVVGIVEKFQQSDRAWWCCCCWRRRRSRRRKKPDRDRSLSGQRRLGTLELFSVSWMWKVEPKGRNTASGWNHLT
jgi:hypothetical protein